MDENVVKLFLNFQSIQKLNLINNNKNIKFYFYTVFFFKSQFSNDQVSLKEFFLITNSVFLIQE